MTEKLKKLKPISVIIALIVFILTIGATITFSRFSDGYNKDNDVKIANAVAKIAVNSVYRTSQDNVRISASFDKNADSITLYDVEPEDEIEYYFTVSGIDGQRVNEVTMNVTITVTVRLETIAADGSGKRVDYFAGWTVYDETDGIKDKAYLKVYRGGENDSARDIRPSSSGGADVDFSGNTLSIVNTADGILNKTGLIMSADDGKKDYPYHIAFTLPKQNAEKENYAGARVFFEIQAVAEQIMTK